MFFRECISNLCKQLHKLSVIPVPEPDLWNHYLFLIRVQTRTLWYLWIRNHMPRNPSTCPHYTGTADETDEENECPYLTDDGEYLYVLPV
ncbi:hypothetical protein Desti_3367 [Desulfomonile tiedjei DSM 6799]|uniref:Uncharacterized protein n=1 Tax=Desulfomonile tiedjei (strain ATCC 49306 / DSM 6799 / DCB-1) TaxID=706587 RepID=I4C8Y1_DESTA|nr:hypothetical protein Desti_3367 [Desulfomonile tiedjei DSM 6799]